MLNYKVTKEMELLENKGAVTTCLKHIHIIIRIEK